MPGYETIEMKNGDFLFDEEEIEDQLIAMKYDLGLKLKPKINKFPFGD